MDHNRSTKEKDSTKGNSAITTSKSETLTQDEVIRRRLVADGDGSGDDRRIQSCLKAILSLCSSEEFNPTEDDLAFRRIMQQIQQLEYTAKRTHASILMNEDSKNVYSTLQTAIHEESEKTKAAIVDAKRVIEEETKHRKHSLEYEALSKLIESKPDRKATEIRRKELEETLKNYTELRKDLIAAVENRERQVNSLTFAITSLKAGIEEEDSKLWESSPLGDIVMMESDAFPLEKEQFPPLTLEPPSSSGSPVTVQQHQPDETLMASPTIPFTNSTNDLASTSSPSVPTKDKYEELSEESPEEGESED